MSARLPEQTGNRNGRGRSLTQGLTTAFGYGVVESLMLFPALLMLFTWAMGNRWPIGFGVMVGAYTLSALWGYVCRPPAKPSAPASASAPAV